MTDLVYPNLPGLAFPIGRAAFWKNEQHTVSSGRTFRTSRWTYPKWRFRLRYEFLQAEDYEQLVGFWNQLGGPFGTFLFVDPDASVATNQQFGTGDGATTRFALLRNFGGHLEPIGKVNGSIVVTVNGNETEDYTLLDGWAIELASAPAEGAVLRWTGGYYLRCEFVDEELEVEEFMHRIYSAAGIEFQTWFP